MRQETQMPPLLQQPAWGGGGGFIRKINDGAGPEISNIGQRRKLRQNRDAKHQGLSGTCIRDYLIY